MDQDSVTDADPPELSPAEREEHKRQLEQIYRNFQFAKPKTKESRQTWNPSYMGSNENPSNYDQYLDQYYKRRTEYPVRSD